MGSNEWLWVVTDHLHAAELRPEVSCKIQQTHYGISMCIPSWSFGMG